MLTGLRKVYAPRIWMNVWFSIPEGNHKEELPLIKPRQDYQTCLTMDMWSCWGASHWEGQIFTHQHCLKFQHDILIRLMHNNACFLCVTPTPLLGLRRRLQTLEWATQKGKVLVDPVSTTMYRIWWNVFIGNVTALCLKEFCLFEFSVCD